MPRPKTAKASWNQGSHRKRAEPGTAGALSSFATVMKRHAKTRSPRFTRWVGWGSGSSNYSASRLSVLQRDVMRAFFALEHRFFLSGGGALVGFHLGHRETDDLDLFATEAILEDGLRALRGRAS